MAAQDASTAARVARSGMELLQPQQGLAALEGLLGGLSASKSGAAAMGPLVAGVPFVWDAFMKRFSAGAAPPLLQSYVAQKQTTGLATNGATISGQLGESGRVLTAEVLKEVVVETVTGVLGQSVSPDEPLMAAGLDSLGAVELRNALEGALGLSLPGTLVFDYPSVDAMTQFISSQIPAAEASEDCLVPSAAGSSDMLKAVTAAAIRAEASMQAVIGITGIAAYSPSSAITCLQPIDAISTVPLSRWDWENLAAAAAGLQGGMMPARFGGWLSGIEMFDAGLFGISGVEAELMDAQQRLLLQASHQAITAAAGAGGAEAGGSLRNSSVMEVTAAAGVNTCVAVGIASAEYNNWVLRRQGVATSAYSATGGALSVASGRLAFLYGMRGPALSVDTACSSSLVAAHFVYSQIMGGVSRAGLAAGAGLLLSPEPTSMFQKAGMLAADGRCKTLDAAADGYVRAEAVGALVMQLIDGVNGETTCAAIFRGSAVNQDGRSSSLTAPNGPAQQEVIRTALAAAGLQPHQVTALQLHGTGTALGDPIEMGAAAAVFFSKEAQTARHQPMVATASKSWMGHTEAAAGSMGLIHAFTGKLERAILIRDGPTCSGQRARIF
jgi:3-oxoacyl-(acyl-carrier-protein) synthase/acyl carrier protein